MKRMDGSEKCKQNLKGNESKARRGGGQITGGDKVGGK